MLDIQKKVKKNILDPKENHAFHDLPQSNKAWVFHFHQDLRLNDDGHVNDRHDDVKTQISVEFEMITIQVFLKVEQLIELIGIIITFLNEMFFFF